MNIKVGKTDWSCILCGIVLSIPLVATAEDINRLDKRFDKTPEPKSSVKPTVLPMNEQSPPDKASEIKFIFKELHLKGNTVFSNQELEPLYADFLGKEISLLDVYKIRNAITAKYGNAGYGLSKAIISEQTIHATGGVVNIDIIEGFVDTVIIEGATDEQQEYLAYAAEQIKVERPLNVRTLERYLLLANDRFAIKVTSTLKPSEKTPAASTLILKVETAPKLEGGVSFDNRGTKAVGAMQISSNVAVNGLFGRASQTALSYVTTQQLRELQYVSISHTEVLYKEGTTLNFTWTGTESEPGIPALRSLNYKSSSSDWVLKLNHPFLRTREENLSGYLKYEARDTTGQSLGQLTLNDKIRSLRLGLNFDNRDYTDAVNQLLLEYSFGIRGLGATPYGSQLKSRIDGRSDYQKFTVSALRRQPLGYFSPWLNSFSINLVMFGQYAGSGLLTSEKCGIGGRQMGKAYDPSEILGDSCLAGSLELAYNTPLEWTQLRYSQLYGFYDGGATFDHMPTNANDNTNKSLMSIGGGFRFGLSDYISASIEGTQPLTRVIANKGNRDPRIFATFSVRF